MLSNTIEGWNEHLNDGLECLADTLLKIKGCFTQVGLQLFNNTMCRFVTASPVHLVIAFCALNSFAIPLP